jgi:hypothetical protein
MIRTCSLVAISAFILLNAASAMAQTTSYEPDPGTRIINDRTGKYVGIDGGDVVKPHVAETCHGRPNRFVFAKIGQSLFRFSRNEILDIYASPFARIKLADDRYRSYFPADYGCPETPMLYAAIDIRLREPAISLHIREDNIPPSERKRSHGGYNCSTQQEFNFCLTANGHAERFEARDPDATALSGAPLSYMCYSKECSLGDWLPDGTEFSLTFNNRTADSFSPMPMRELRRLYDLGYAAMDRFRVKE